MKILVPVKRVVDPYVKIRVRSDQTAVETQNVKMTINPFDEIALEEALRLTERQLATEIIAVSIGDNKSQETLRHALALGAHRAILLASTECYCSLNIAKILSKIVIDEQIDLVLMGKQAIDSDSNQTAQMLAGLLNWPQGTFISHLIVEDGKLTVIREVDGGAETLTMELPAVLSADLRLNEPRYASLPNIMRAKSKPLQIINVAELNLNLQQRQKILAVRPPKTRDHGVEFVSVPELVIKLRREANLSN